MTIYVGGLRSRLVKDSLFNMIEAALEDLGWFDTGRQHAPITFRSYPYDEEEQVAVNSLALSDEDLVVLEQELGSIFAEHDWQFFIDFYAEDNALGVHMAHDLEAILAGRMPSIGRASPNFPVYDYTLATPEVIAWCEIEDVVVDRARGFPKPWQKFWYVVSFNVLDYYGNEDDA